MLGWIKINKSNNTKVSIGSANGVQFIENPMIHRIKMIEHGWNKTLHNPCTTRIRSPSQFKKSK